MLQFLWKKIKLKEAEIISEQVISETNQLLKKYFTKVEERLSIIEKDINQIKKYSFQIDKKIKTKEMKDYQSYGQLRYQLQGQSNAKLKNEIEDMKKQLSKLKESDSSGFDFSE